jgi:hypothetical protein
MNCPFYGRAFIPGDTIGGPPFSLFDQRGNRCALVTNAHAPCYLEIEGKEPDWKTCALVELVRWEEPEA